MLMKRQPSVGMPENPKTGLAGQFKIKFDLGGNSACIALVLLLLLLPLSRLILLPSSPSSSRASSACDVDRSPVVGFFLFRMRANCD